MADQPEPVAAISEVTAWKNAPLPKLPPELAAAAQQVQSLTEIVRTGLTVVSDVLTLIAQLQVNFEDPVRAALQQVIQAIEAALDSLTADTAVYVLFVPVRRKVIVSPLIQEALSLTGIANVPKNKSYDLQVLEAKLVASNPQVARFLKFPADGGNAGFLRTVSESTVDPADYNRPLFGPTAFVGGVHVLAGAPNYADLLGFITAIDALFDQPRGLAVSGKPVPQNLRVDAIRLITGQPGAALSWDAQDRVVPIPELDIVCAITRVAIIRSTNPEFLSATSPEKLFGTSRLNKGMQSADGKTEVIDVVDVGTFVPTSYGDTTGTLIDGTTYYYAVSFNLKTLPLAQLPTLDEQDDPVFRRFYKLSNVASVTPKQKSTRSGLSTPADWQRTPVLNVLPATGIIVDVIKSALREFSAGTASSTAALDNFIRFLQSEIEKVARYSDQIAAVIQTITSLLTQDAAVRIYARPFFGVGGTDFMVADLATSLSPENTDEGRPSFDRGDEFVTGIVLLAGAPSAAAVQPIVTALSALVGLTNAGVASAIATAIAGVDVVLSAIEQEEVADLQPEPTITQASTAPDVPLSDQDPGSCAPDATLAPAFADDFGV